MLSKSDSKFIKSLQLKKYRKSAGLFIAEGRKNLLELIRSNFEIERLYLTQSFYEQEQEKLKRCFKKIEFVSKKELISSGTFKSNESGLALVRQAKTQQRPVSSQPLTLALDDIRDPGNLGTIIRIADWYGMNYLVCSPNCADCYNPKVISASMGSFFRVNCIYKELADYFKENSGLEIMGAVMNGTNTHQYAFPKKGILVMGNESTGINKALEPYLTQRITIPRFGQAESLNVATATAIICDNFYLKNAPG